MLYVLTCAFVDYFSRLLPLVPRLKDIHFDSLHGKMVQVTFENMLTFAFFFFITLEPRVE